MRLRKPLHNSGGAFKEQSTLTEIDPLNRFETKHREERRKITNICALPLLLFFG